MSFVSENTTLINYYKIGLAFALGAYSTKFLIDNSSTILNYGKFKLTNYAQKFRFRRFHKDKKLPVNKNEDNTLMLFHGRKHGMILNDPSYGSINYEKTNTYTVTNNPNDKPHLCLDLRKDESLLNFEDASFDTILSFFCICHTANVIEGREEFFFNELYRILKPDGKLYIKNFTSIFKDKTKIKNKNENNYYIVSYDNDEKEKKIKKMNRFGFILDDEHEIPFEYIAFRKVDKSLIIIDDQKEEVKSPIENVKSPVNDNDSCVLHEDIDEYLIVKVLMNKKDLFPKNKSLSRIKFDKSEINFKELKINTEDIDNTNSNQEEDQEEQNSDNCPK
jgi:SAM-dependent methyltransferase